MASTITTFDGLMKERYTPHKIEELVYPDNPLLARLTKMGDTQMAGEKEIVPILYGNPQGTSGVFANALTRTTNVKTESWDIPAGDYYGVVEIGDKVLKAARNNTGAFMENKRVEIDGLYETAGENLSIYAWGNGGQALGKRLSQSADVVTLAEPSAVSNFEVGMYVGASANDGSDSSHTLLGSPSYTEVTAIDRGNGTITYDVSDIASHADGDFLFRQGDFFGDQGVVVIVGVQSFLQPAGATAPALHGIAAATRATDRERFSGCSMDSASIAGRSYEERVKMLFSRMTGRYKSKAPTECYMHPEDIQVLESLLTARGQRSLESDNTKFGFAKIDITTSAGRVPIYSDRHCPKGTLFAFRMDDWWVSSMGELLHVQNGDGFEMLRRDTSTNYQYRIISYPLLACRSPKNSGRVSLVD